MNGPPGRPPGAGAPPKPPGPKLAGPKLAPPKRPPPPPKKKRGAPLEVSPAVLLSRQKGALLGLAVGDAFGVTNEHRRVHAPVFPELCEPVHFEMRGQGPFKLKVGQVTDETQLACVLAESLMTEGKHDPAITAKAYFKWLAHAIDVDEQTRASLSAVGEGRSPEFAGRSVWLDSQQRASSSTVLGRTTPIGVYFCKDQRARIAATFADCATTHFDPRCQLACVVHNAAVAAAITSTKERADTAELLQHIEADLSLAAADLAKMHPEFVIKIQLAADWVREDVKLAQDDDPQLYGPDLHLLTHESYVRVASRLSLWELFHVPHYEAALIDVANRGGDTDTNCAVTGALFGALQGDSCIPPTWLEPVMQVLEGFSSPLRTRYHPEQLIALAGQVPGKPVPRPD